MQRNRLLATVGLGAAVALALGSHANAGPFIFAGTDADDHGSATSTANLDGWFFMQRAIENLAGNVTNGNKIVVSLGSDPGTQAGLAAQSAFAFSTLASTGYTFVTINGSAAITSFFSLGGGASTAALIMLDSSAVNVVGGLSALEETTITTNASSLNSFLANGGGLFSQANSYGFLSTLVPSLTVLDDQSQNIQLTAAGTATFPSLTNADLSAGPFHESFSNTGLIPILGIGQSDGGQAIIIGSQAGSITNPTGPTTGVPEPATLTLLAGLALAGIATRRSRQT